jgi:hypothetical protein
MAVSNTTHEFVRMCRHCETYTCARKRGFWFCFGGTEPATKRGEK